VKEAKMSTLFLVLAVICFGIAAFAVETVGPVKLLPLGLFFLGLSMLV
jgi:hypothetical protein